MQLDEVKSNIERLLGKEAATLLNLLLKQKPVPADAIILIQGDRLDRAPLAKELYQKGFAPRIIITGNNVLIGEGKRFEENDIHLSELKNYLIKEGIPEKNISIEDQSFNTKDQAAHSIKTAARNHWSKLLIVTSPYHTVRTYLMFLKQIKEQSWKGKIYIQGADLSWDAPPSGRIKTAREIIPVEIEKIKKHKNDTSDIKEGFEYMKNQLKEEVKIRLLKQSDSKKFWEIRNSESARMWSLNDDKIKFSEHVKWFRAYSANPENICFVLIHEEKPIGYARFDFKDNSYITSMAIAENYQGLGLGNFLLPYSLKQIGHHAREILATIHLNNVASLKLFQKYNFVKYRQDASNAYFVYKP